MSKRNGRWWNGLDGRWRKGQPGMVPALNHGELTAIPEPIARLVYEEYHHDQSFDVLHNRGGFGMAEIIAALADIIERERAAKKVELPKPTYPPKLNSAGLIEMEPQGGVPTVDLLEDDIRKEVNKIGIEVPISTATSYVCTCGHYGGQHSMHPPLSCNVEDCPCAGYELSFEV